MRTNLHFPLILLSFGFQACCATAAETPAKSSDPRSDSLAPVGSLENTPPGSVRFAAYDVYLDTAEGALAAYQLDIRATAGRVRIVGIEGGEPDAFRKPPYYDPKAIQRERVILAAFSTALPNSLPKGKIRVATLHVLIEGNLSPRFATVLEAVSASGADKESITITVSERKEHESMRP